MYFVTESEGHCPVYHTKAVAIPIILISKFKVFQRQLVRLLRVLLLVSPHHPRPQNSTVEKIALVLGLKK